MIIILCIVLNLWVIVVLDKNIRNFLISHILFWIDNKPNLTWSDKHPCNYNDEKLAKCTKLFTDMEE